MIIVYNTLKEIGQKFRLPGEIYSYDTITMGNINSTYKVTYVQNDKSLKSYLFQRVNTYVFKKPVEIMENIDRVTTFIRSKYPDQIALHFHHTGSIAALNRADLMKREGNYPPPAVARNGWIWKLQARSRKWPMATKRNPNEKSATKHKS